MNKLSLLLMGALLAFNVVAQTQESAPSAEQLQKETPASQSSAAQTGRKMIGEANINLQTTVTGNQEQPRVMYILPWQSPLSPDLEMEMLSSQEDSVFGHVERDEMQRHLEASGELDSSE